ncbi:MAG TPA: NAD-glutamate dehydrogenase [Gammaproteobacteria bacterium]|nr:NAD-glutamate dehydrogenase [Gammaproteobacteria bacterium]
MAPRSTDARQRHLDKVIALSKKSGFAKNAGGDLEEFIRQFYRSVSDEDLLERAPADLLGAACSIREFGARRTLGRPNIRVYNPSRKKDGWESTHTVVEMVNDDMPFLVDSMTMALNKHGLGIHLTIHPILRVRRDKRGTLTDVIPLDQSADDVIVESFMQVFIDRETRPEKLAELERYLLQVMDDVRAAVTDWGAMLDKCHAIISQLQTSPPPLPVEEVSEGKRFLEWLADNHFTFLGYREYDLIEQDGEDVLRVVPGSGLGILRETGADVSKSFMVLPKDVRAHARAKTLLIITKANSIATVHRAAYLDYIGIKRFNKQGEVIGEQRFLGLFTSSAYSARPRDIPLLRHKVEQVMLRSKLPPRSHAGKALLHLLETFPRDELFQSSTDELFDTVMGVVQLQERQRVKLFVRRDSFGRFFSCLVYVPRDRYNTQVREKIEAILKAALGGKHVESQSHISESLLARIHVIVRVTPWQMPSFDLKQIEKQIAGVVRAWQDDLREALVEKFGEERGLKLFRKYGEYFPAAYREDVKPKAAAFDVEQLDTLTDDNSLAMTLYRPQHNPKSLLRFKIFRREQTISISEALPMLENMGVKVVSERPYELELGDASILWIQDFEIIHSCGDDFDPANVREIFQEAFARVFRGEAENDRFNSLVLRAQLTWRQVALIRAICKYILQTSLTFSQAYIEQTLVSNAHVARLFVRLFETRFDPAFRGDRNAESERLRQELAAALDAVASLDEDRILRAFLHVIEAMLRTNYYQTLPGGVPKPYISFKLDPQKIPELPLPRPMFEIWVYSPRVEGVHLRFGKVARGGLRWSDRREDFRTEVLGLVKAQQVKNAVIVPVGAKGGFYVKRPPAGGDREAVMKEGIACYQTFLRGLLDITDNIDGTKIVPPKDVVRHDGDDPYLVVAADKGTATFSDIANAISAEYGFWLGDAFASGGSAGYDHKKMGITAKGAWESVKRHFRELGIDCETSDFTAVGIGDMSGDVFGNGMLLSRHIRLIAAFDHRHIFIDPNPDAATSYRERERLFNLPRSSWADYDATLISKGGGVFPRTAKSIRLTAEAAQALGVAAGNYTPAEVIRAILKAPVDLLWNGGIGTYVKATRESHADVGDRANDAVRVNGVELRCRVVAEGGNLGFTQLGRVEYALNGGRINTDFIDNSGGVDCSDHEVNIKILLNLAIAEKRLTGKTRDKLLADMTDEVAQLVLRDNYMQAQALSVAEAQAPTRITEHAHFIRTLERSGELNRALEFLPSDDEMQERRKAGRGLTRPELAILLAYAKMAIYDDLLNSDVPEDPYLATELAAYFPAPLQKKFADLMPKHRLRREIVATAITNSMVNRMGAVFAQRMQEESGASAAIVARAYTTAREAFDIRNLWSAIESLDNKVPAAAQIGMMVQTGQLVRYATRWFLNRPQERQNIAEAVARYKPGILALLEALPKLLVASELERYTATVSQFTEMGVPERVARHVALLRPLFSGLDLVDIAAQTGLDVTKVARVYFELDLLLGLDWLREQIERLAVDGRWQAIARGSLRENLYAQHRRIAAAILGGNPRSATQEKTARWLAEREQRVQHFQRVLNDMRGIGALDFATASVALQELNKIV